MTRFWSILRSIMFVLGIFQKIVVKLSKLKWSLLCLQICADFFVLNQSHPSWLGVSQLKNLQLSLPFAVFCVYKSMVSYSRIGVLASLKVCSYRLCYRFFYSKSTHSIIIKGYSSLKIWSHRFCLQYFFSLKRSAPMWWRRVPA